MDQQTFTQMNYTTWISNTINVWLACVIATSDHIFQKCVLRRNQTFSGWKKIKNFQRISSALKLPYLWPFLPNDFLSKAGESRQFAEEEKCCRNSRIQAGKHSQTMVEKLIIDVFVVCLTVAEFLCCVHFSSEYKIIKASMIKLEFYGNVKADWESEIL